MIIKPRVSQDTFVKTKLILNEDGTGVKLDLPFPVTGQTIKCKGVDVTYSLSDLSLAGKKVVAWICYDDDEQGNSVKNYIGMIGKDPLASSDYIEAYPDGGLFCEMLEVKTKLEDTNVSEITP